MRFKLKCAELLAEERRQLTAQFMRARREAQVGSPQREVLHRRALRRWRGAARRVAWIRQSDTFPPSAGAHGPWLARWMGGWVRGGGGVGGCSGVAAVWAVVDLPPSAVLSESAAAGRVRARAEGA